MSARKGSRLEAFVSVDPDGHARPILCATKEDAEYQNRRTRSGKGVTVRLAEVDPLGEAVVAALMRWASQDPEGFDATNAALHSALNEIRAMRGVGE